MAEAASPASTLKPSTNAINIYVLKAGKIRRSQRAQFLNSGPGQSHACNRAYCSQQKRFCQKRTNQPPSTGANGGAHSEFTLAQAGPDQQQVGYVRTGDEQKKNH